MLTPLAAGSGARRELAALATCRHQPGSPLVAHSSETLRHTPIKPSRTDKSCLAPTHWPLAPGQHGWAQLDTDGGGLTTPTLTEGGRRPLAAAGAGATPGQRPPAWKEAGRRGDVGRPKWAGERTNGRQRGRPEPGPCQRAACLGPARAQRRRDARPASRLQKHAPAAGRRTAPPANGGGDATSLKEMGQAAAAATSLQAGRAAAAGRRRLEVLPARGMTQAASVAASASAVRGWMRVYLRRLPLTAAVMQDRLAAEKG